MTRNSRRSGLGAVVFELLGTGTVLALLMFRHAPDPADSRVELPRVQLAAPPATAQPGVSVAPDPAPRMSPADRHHYAADQLDRHAELFRDLLVDHLHQLLQQQQPTAQSAR